MTKPQQLAQQLQTSTMHGFKKRVIVVFILGALLFMLRDSWGMRTENVTSLLTTMTYTDYTIARYASLAGALIWALVYMAFHFWGFAYILSAITSIPFKKLLPLQLLVTGVLLLEKALVFLVFYMKGATTSVSFLSFGPLAMTFLKTDYLVYFLNQLTITSALMISLQLNFIRTYTASNNWKKLLTILIAIYVLMALLTAAIGFIPIENLLRSVVGGVIHA